MTSPDENAEIVRRLGEVWRDSGIAAMATEFLAPDVGYEDDPAWPDHRAAHGRDAVVERFEDWMGAWGDELDSDIERVQAVDDQVVGIFVVRTKGTTSGCPRAIAGASSSSSGTGWLSDSAPTSTPLRRSERSDYRDSALVGRARYPVALTWIT